MWLRQFSLKSRFTLLVGVVLTAFVAMGMLSIANIRDNIFEERKRALTGVVESATSIVEGYYRRYQNGEISQTEAQQLAKETLRNIRYEGENYVWINDLDSIMIMHPISPAVENTSVADLADANGVKVFPLLVDLVKSQGSGYIEYMWLYEDGSPPENKMSYVKGFEPWGWVIGTGVWALDLQASVDAAALTISMQSAVFITVIGFIAFLIIRSVSIPIRRMVVSSTTIVNNGKIDLHQRFPQDGQDELTQLSQCINAVFAKLKDTLQHVVASQNIVTNTSTTVSDTVQKTNVSLAHQQQEVDSLTRSMAEMGTKVSEVSKNTETAVMLSSEATDEANSGSIVIKNTVAEIKQLYDTMQTTKSSMETLAHDVASIDSVLDVINGIAEQTNLLALNAAIEAARAGEQGRGFAVVADEVRNLAQRTQQSTQEIQKIIERLQNGTNASVNHMTLSAEKAEAASEFGNNAGLAFDKIRMRIGDIDRNTALIAAAAQQQALTSEHIDKAVNAIRQAMLPVRDSMEDTAKGANELRNAVADVQSGVKNIILSR